RVRARRLGAGPEAKHPRLGLCAGKRPCEGSAGDSQPAARHWTVRLSPPGSSLFRLSLRDCGKARLTRSGANYPCFVLGTGLANGIGAPSLEGVRQEKLAREQLRLALK